MRTQRAIDIQELERSLLEKSNDLQAVMASTPLNKALAYSLIAEMEEIIQAIKGAR
jgi:hypothetical protein